MKNMELRILGIVQFCIKIWIGCFFVFSSVDLLAVPPNSTHSSSKDSIAKESFFNSSELLEFTLEADFVTLLNDIDKSRKYHKSQISYRNQQNQAIDLNVKIKTRGKFRLRKQNCNFPPLKFNFSKEGAKGTIFAGQDKLKFVSHCQNDDLMYEQHTLEEYLIYRIYNLITDNSFRVRLARITYVDRNTSDSLTRFGFFVEDRDQMAKRLGRSILEYKNIQQYDVLRSNMIQLSLFQLMIGNTDWSVEKLHNIDLISIDDNSIPLAIPFDFDWSGLIGHSYFVPDPKIDPEAKYQRIYKSYQWNKDDLEKAIQRYLLLKDDLFLFVNTFPYLNLSNREKCIHYLSEFYEIIESKRNIKNYLVKGLPKIPN
ncbi:MAG: hypothetical protein ACEPOZ_21035 [Marinifilaceae bacterium]